MEIKKISVGELKKRLDNGEDVLVIDVMPPEFFNDKHIAGSQNAPVYETSFLEQVQKITSDKDQAIVVYNENRQSMSAEDAALKLLKAGFGNTQAFVGGLRDWMEKGFDLEKGEPLKMPEVTDGVHEIDIEKSVVAWTGRNFKYAHRGRVDLKMGHIVVENKKPARGEFILNMKTIRNEDLADENMRGVLENHLKSMDFFEVETYPEASFVFSKVDPIAGGRMGMPNYHIWGSLTIKDIANPVDFPAVIVLAQDGSIHGHAHFDIDRTLWNVRYGSEKFFENLGIHLVNDAVSLDLFLVAKA